MNIKSLRLFKTLTFVTIIALGVGCFRQDRRTITVRAPQVKSADCLRLVQEAAKSVEGIEMITPNYEQGTLDVTYNALKLGIRNIEFVIAGAGFDANDTQAPAQARAALPEGCR